MKSWKKRLAVLLMLVLTLAFGTNALAAKNKLVKKGGKYYYYNKSGKMLKNTWKTVKQKKVRYRFYFGKNGAAYTAKKTFDGSYNVKVAKIKGKKYGFDAKSHLVAEGVYADNRGRLWAFGAGGVLDNARTQALRSAIPVGTVGKDLMQKVISVFGTPDPAQPETAESCDKWNAVNPDTDSFTDIMMNYGYYQVQLVRNDQTGEYKMNGFVALRK